LILNTGSFYVLFTRFKPLAELTSIRSLLLLLMALFQQSPVNEFMEFLGCLMFIARSSCSHIKV